MLKCFCLKGQTPAINIPPTVLKYSFNNMNKINAETFSGFPPWPLSSFCPPLCPPVRCYNPQISPLPLHLYTSFLPFTGQVPAIKFLSNPYFRTWFPPPSLPSIFMPAFPVLPHALPACLPSSLKLIKTGLIRLLFKQCNGQTDAVNS